MRKVAISMILAITLLLISCTQKKKESNLIVTRINSMNDGVGPIEDLKDSVLKKGDTIAYRDLKFAFTSVKHDVELLPYSMLMSNKYHYPKAYYDVYCCLIALYDNNKDGIDDQTLKMALKYLRKGVELHDVRATSTLGELYFIGKYVPKDTILGKKMLIELGEDYYEGRLLQNDTILGKKQKKK